MSNTMNIVIINMIYIISMMILYDIVKQYKYTTFFTLCTLVEEHEYTEYPTLHTQNFSLQTLQNIQSYTYITLVYKH